MYSVYVLESQRNRKLYYGQTRDLDKRLSQHNTGLVRSTKSGIPWKMVYFEKAETALEARKKEKYFKSGFGRKYVRNKIKALSSIG